MALATAEAIRNQIATLLEALTPSNLSSTKFRQFRNEGDADFDSVMEKNPPAALRRFQVREVGDDEPPLVSNLATERVRLRVEIRIAYPQTHRYGPANGMDRDDVMNQDWRDINYKIGLYGRGNFSSTHDCTPLGAVKTREEGGKIDYLVIAADYEYLRSLTA